MSFLSKTSEFLNGVNDFNQDWDDTELIKAYNETIGDFRAEKAKLKADKSNSNIIEAPYPGEWVSSAKPNSSSASAPFKLPFKIEQELIKLRNSSSSCEDEEKEEPKLVVDKKETQLFPTPEDDQERLYLLTWAVGSPCRAIYSEDGIEYEAKIIQIDDDLTNCIVRYVGYGNEEQIPLKDLKSTKGKQVRTKQREEALAAESYLKQNEESNAVPSTSKANTARIIQSTFEFESAIPPSAKNTSKSKSKSRRKKNKERKAKLNYVRNNISGFTSESESEEEEEQVVEEQQQDFESQGAGAGAGTGGIGKVQADWLKVFPNLFMPPMPSSFLSANNGQRNFAKGDLSSLLMTWYMAGYHSGYFDAKQDIKLQRQRQIQKEQQHK